ncbi:MAG: oligosaccharide flippase family protein [Bacilli bacterium]|nr:oligosaccharide flippase family protein [Bacilli bacterium]
MKQKKLIKSLLHLISFSFAAKMLSIIAKILTTRAVGVEGMSYFSIVSPIMLLLYTIGQLGLPTAITRMISSNYEKRYKIMITSLIIGVFVNIIILFILYLSAPFIANTLLKSPQSLNTIYMLGLLTPLVFLSGIIKGYLFGVNKIKISSISQVTEEIGRIIFIFIFFNYIGSLSPTNASMFAVIGLIVAEVIQILTQIIGNYKCFDRNYNKFKTELTKKDNYIFKEILLTSLPISSNRFITTFTYFLEPIILINIMNSYSNNIETVIHDYGLLESYAVPILFLPGFFSSALSTFMLPNLSSLISKNSLKTAKKLILTVTIISLFIGSVSSIVCFLFPEFLLNLLYKNIDAVKYVKRLSLPFIIYFIEAPISTCMYALSMEKESLIVCIISSIFRVLSLFLFIPKFNVIGTAISTIIEVLTIVILDLFFIFRFFKYKNKTCFIIKQ